MTLTSNSRNRCGECWASGSGSRCAIAVGYLASEVVVSVDVVARSRVEAGLYLLQSIADGPNRAVWHPALVGRASLANAWRRARASMVWRGVGSRVYSVSDVDVAVVLFD